MTGTLVESDSTRASLAAEISDTVSPSTFGDLTFGSGTFGGSAVGQAQPDLTDAPSTRGTLS